MTDGGDGSNPSEEIKRKISIANKNSKRTEEHRQKISDCVKKYYEDKRKHLRDSDKNRHPE